MPSSSKPRNGHRRDSQGAMSDAERRTTPREERSNPVRVFLTDPSGEALFLDGDLVNLSDGGALINAIECLMPGQECLVTIKGPAGDVVVDSAFAMVRWASVRDEGDFLIGIEFADRESGSS